MVKTIEADFNNETGNIAFRATFPNPDGLLRHGETGNIQMTVPLKNAIIIPQKSLLKFLKRNMFMWWTKIMWCRPREITIAAEMPDLYVIKGGLAENEKIMLEGIRKVKENDKINYEYEDPKS